MNTAVPYPDWKPNGKKKAALFVLSRNVDASPSVGKPAAPAAPASSWTNGPSAQLHLTLKNPATDCYNVH